jgi:hypothetical protein
MKVRQLTITRFRGIEKFRVTLEHQLSAVSRSSVRRRFLDIHSREDFHGL